MKPTAPHPDDKLLNFFQRALDVNHAFYGLGIDVLAAYSPLLATLIPAYLTYHSTLTYLHFAPWMAFTTAAVVEVLGLAAVHTTISLREYNASLTRKTDQRAPLDIAFAASIAYILIVLVVNVGLDIFAAKVSWIIYTVKGFLSLLSVIGALIVAVRAQQSLRTSGNDPATVQQLNERIQGLNERHRKQNETIQQLNDEIQRLNASLNEQNTTHTNTVHQLNTEIATLNAQLDEANTYRIVFTDQLNAAERIHRAAELFPNASHNTLANLLNISKAYVSQVFTANGFHRTTSEQD